MKWLRQFIDYLIYITGKITFLILFKIFYFLKIKGRENVPDTGGFIIVSNHASFLDPPLIGIAVWKRKLKFMARHTLFKNKIISKILNAWGGFPIKRGTIDRNSWKTFENLVRQGEGVVFFPEGTRTEDGEIKDAKPGAGMLVYKARSIVIPVYIHNSYKAFSKHKKIPNIFVPITVIIGKPIKFDEYFDKKETKELYKDIGKKMMDNIKELKVKFLKGEIK